MMRAESPRQLRIHYRTGEPQIIAAAGQEEYETRRWPVASAGDLMDRKPIRKAINPPPQPDGSLVDTITAIPSSTSHFFAASASSQIKNMMLRIIPR